MWKRGGVGDRGDTFSSNIAPYYSALKNKPAKGFFSKLTSAGHPGAGVSLRKAPRHLEMVGSSPSGSLADSLTLTRTVRFLPTNHVAWGRCLTCMLFQMPSSELYFFSLAETMGQNYDGMLGLFFTTPWSLASRDNAPGGHG